LSRPSNASGADRLTARLPARPLGAQCTDRYLDQMPPIHLPKRQAPAPGRWWSLQYVRPYVLAVFFLAVATLARWLLHGAAGAVASA